MTTIILTTPSNVKAYLDNLATINWLLKEIVAKEVQRDKMGVKCITHVCAGHSEMMLAA